MVCISTACTWLLNGTVSITDFERVPGSRTDAGHAVLSDRRSDGYLDGKCCPKESCLVSEICQALLAWNRTYLYNRYQALRCLARECPGTRPVFHKYSCTRTRRLRGNCLHASPEKLVVLGYGAEFVPMPKEKIDRLSAYLQNITNCFKAGGKSLSIAFACARFWLRLRSFLMCSISSQSLQSEISSTCCPMPQSPRAT
ncbi:hypothetical protein ARMGADRAFT_759420 [Armillaria gallica]|uniref:Uncharacterized protein n=1 Tax=Armillaria gallica TaxID=47427 RepID=A0A2H3DZ32_ARMGA|nr:hypothetical protein ARMGADRAFT_759420 [Armillaria gallica]